MKTKKFIVVAAVAVVFSFSNSVASMSQKTHLSDATLANIEALTSDVSFFCDTCKPCTGEYWMCRSDEDVYNENNERNCGPDSDRKIDWIEEC